MNVNVMRIFGNWDLGYVLDWHVKSSIFLGYDESGREDFDTKRTEVGEAIFKLKYRYDLTQIESLAETMVTNLGMAFQTASLIVPMPPSEVRRTQPVAELSKKVAEKMKIAFFGNILLKKKTTSQMKDFSTREEKINALSCGFYIHDGIRNNGSWDALVIDDLYSTGASLSAATQVLRSYHKIRKIFVAAFSRTKFKL